MSKLEEELNNIVAEKNFELAEYKLKVARVKLEVTISCLVNDFLNEHYHEIADEAREDNLVEDSLKKLLKEVNFDKAQADEEDAERD